MVEWSGFGMSSVSSTCFSGSRNDHRVYPAGGAEHARAISRASTSPVTGDGTGGRSRFLRDTVAGASPPVSANRLTTSRSISPETPRRAAITSSGSGSPTEVSSSSRTWARLIDDAGCTPVVTRRINAPRSRADKLTGRFNWDAMSTVLVRQGEGPAGQQPLSHKHHN